MNKENINLQIKNQIKEGIKKLGFYGDVLFKGVFLKEFNIWKNILTFITFLHKDHEKIEEIKNDYGKVCLLKKLISLKEFEQLLDELIEKGKIIVGNLFIEMKGNFVEDKWLDFIPSKYSPFNLDWPCRGYKYECDYRKSMNLPSDPLVSLKLPLFPNTTEAVLNFMKINLRRYDFNNTLFIFLPNYKAKIEQIKIGVDHLLIKVFSKEIKIEKIVGKLYVKGDGGNIIQRDLIFKENELKVSINFYPNYIYLLLLDRQTEEWLDKKEYYYSWREKPEGIIVELPSAQQLEIIVQRGENEEIEFKEKVNEKLVKDVVAFANTNGGIILIGVNDEGEIVGVQNTKREEERLWNILRSHCDPPVDEKLVKIESKIIQQKTILLVEVKEGNKVYHMKDRGIYIRCGSTSRIASSYEAEGLYNKKMRVKEGGYFP